MHKCRAGHEHQQCDRQADQPARQHSLCIYTDSNDLGDRFPTICPAVSLFSLTGFKEGAGGQLQEHAEAEGDGPRENVWAVRGGREAHARVHRHQAA